MVGGPIIRILAQVIVTAGSVISRAFVHAYLEAAQKAKHNQSATKTAQAAAKTVFSRKQIDRSEALKILNFSEKSTPKSVEDIINQYDRYFKANDPKNGGSFYLQSKFFRAKEKLLEEFKQKEMLDKHSTDKKL